MTTFERIETSKTRIRIFTTVGDVIEGDFHHTPSARVSDAIQSPLREKDRYLRLTDVTVQRRDNNEVVASSPFALVSFSQVVAIFPMDGAPVEG